MRRWLVDWLGELNRKIHRLRIWLDRKNLRPVRQQEAISVCYRCNLCGELRPIRHREDIDWTHRCQKIPGVKA